MYSQVSSQNGYGEVNWFPLIPTFLNVNFDFLRKSARGPLKPKDIPGFPPVCIGGISVAHKIGLDDPLRRDDPLGSHIRLAEMTLTLEPSSLQGQLGIEITAGNHCTTLRATQEGAMPRRSKGPHLWFRKERRDRKTGKLKESGVWLILDGRKHTSTGCDEAETGNAQLQLANYIAERYRPPRREQDIESLLVADVLLTYHDDLGPIQANQRVYEGSLWRLNEWWGAKTIDEINGDTCRAYVKERGSPGGARRDLELLRAAINHHAKEGLHRGVVRVWLPEKGEARDRWLTRDEAAKLLWYCWRKREVMTVTRGVNKGQKLPTKRRPLRHTARFILLGLYTGTRAEAIASASPLKTEGRSWVDLEKGIFYRLQEGRKATNKRQPPVKLPPHLLGFLRRWSRPDADGSTREFFVEWNGKTVTTSVKTGFASAVAGARIEHATPHSLRHTAATWLMQNGVDIWEAAGFLGMSEHILRTVYGHHHPDFQKRAAAGFRPRKTA